MQTGKICSLGYFDRVIVDGFMVPMYRNRGIQVNNGESLAESIENNKQSYNQGIGKLRINIYGEVDKNSSSLEEEARMTETRSKLGLNPTKLGLTTRYSIGFADLLILKDDYSFPDNVTQKGKTIDDINKLAKGEDELKLMLKALEAQNDVMERGKVHDSNIAIVDRVYINREFRRCGISKWIHTNIKDIARVYGMIDIAAVLLMPGDFSHEATEVFGMTKNEYENMLKKHYKSLGYKTLKENIMYRDLLKKDRKHIVSLIKGQTS